MPANTRNVPLRSEESDGVVAAIEVVARTGRRFGGPFEAGLPGVAQPLSTRENASARKTTLCALCTAMPMSALR